MIEVQKAVEPRNLSVKGKANLKRMLEGLEQGTDAYIQPKYDGVYAQYIYEDGRLTCWSRTGERLLSGEHPDILSELYRRELWHYPLVGELWRLGKNHSEINGEARRQKVSDWLGFRITDYLIPNRTYMSRMGAVWFQDWDMQARLSPARSWSSVLGDSLEDLATRWASSTDGAYDGLILRDKYGAFTPGPGKDGGIIKIKPRKSGDFKVVGVAPGIGNRAGGIGALVLSLGNGKTCEVGSGLTKEQVFQDPAEFIGKIVEVHYLSVTKDGRLREPSFKSVRWDKTVGDIL